MSVFKEMTKCLSFDSYNQFRKDTTGKNFRYLLVMSLLCWLITVVIGWSVWFGTIGSDLIEDIPYFSMSAEGVLTAEEIMDETEDGERLVIDSGSDFTLDSETGDVYREANGVSEQFMNTSDYNKIFLVGKTRVVFTNDSTGDVSEFNYSDLPASYLEKINSDFLVSALKWLVVIIAVIAFVFIFIRLVLWNIVNAALAAVIGSTMGVRNTFGQLYSMALRAYTPMYLICCILSVLGILIPFKMIICLLVTGFILTRVMKAVKAGNEQADQESNSPSANE